jgi:hypothetical protein
MLLSVKFQLLSINPKLLSTKFQLLSKFQLDSEKYQFGLILVSVTNPISISGNSGKGKIKLSSVPGVSIHSIALVPQEVAVLSNQMESYQSEGRYLPLLLRILSYQ